MTPRDETPRDHLPDGVWTTVDRIDLDAYRRWRGQAMSRFVSGLGLSSRVGNWLLAVPDLGNMLVRFMADPEVDIALKLRLVAVIAVMVSPQGRWLSRKAGVKGVLKSLGALGLGMDTLVQALPRDAIKRHWAGSEETLARILAAADATQGAVPMIRRAASTLVGRGGRRRG